MRRLRPQCLLCLPKPQRTLPCQFLQIIKRNYRLVPTLSCQRQRGIRYDNINAVPPLLSWFKRLYVIKVPILNCLRFGRIFCQPPSHAESVNQWLPWTLQRSVRNCKSFILWSGSGKNGLFVSFKKLAFPQSTVLWSAKLSLCHLPTGRFLNKAIWRLRTGNKPLQSILHTHKRSRSIILKCTSQTLYQVLKGDLVGA